jgi:hypothetical protein
MRFRNILFLLFLVAFYSCKKEELASDSTGALTVYNFSVDKCITTNDNSFLLLGDKTLAKVDAQGNVLWKKSSYGGDYVLPLKNNQSLLCVDASTYLFVEIVSNSGSSAKTFSLTVSGNERIANPIATELSTGELLFMGTSVNGVDSTLYLIKTNSNGNPIWNKKTKLNFNIAHIDKAITSASGNNIILIGNTGKIGGKNAMSFVKIDTSGTLVWENKKTFGIWENYATEIHRIDDNNYLITGYFDKSTTLDYNYQFCAYKMNGMGDSLNLYVTGATKQDYCTSSIYLPSEDNLIMLGMEGRGRNTQDLNLANIKILTLNASLSSVVSDYTYAQLQACQAMSAIKNEDGSLSVIGKKYAYGNANIVHSFFMKIKPDGTFK